jgi:hypothetical protein
VHESAKNLGLQIAYLHIVKISGPQITNPQIATLAKGPQMLQILSANSRICYLRTNLLSKFATGINQNSGTGGKFTVSLIPVMYLDLQISPRILKKFEMVLLLFSGAWGKLIQEKNLMQKIS